MDDLDLEVADLLCANRAQVNIGDVGDLVRGEGLGGLVDLVGDALGSWCAVGKVVLDTEIFLGTCAWLAGRVSKALCA